MPLNWIDVRPLSFNTLLLLERAQIGWLIGFQPDDKMAIALQANPVVEWYLRHKNPELTPWLDQVMAKIPPFPPTAEAIRQAEISVLERIEDWLIYVLDPTIYDSLEFLNWDSTELTSLVDFSGKTVIDIGSGTGRLAFVAAEFAKVVFAVEPVENLRRFLKTKAHKHGFHNFYAVDGLISDLPFPQYFADVVICGHVFGDQPRAEFQEMKRITQKGGMIILCPGSNGSEEQAHQFLVEQGFNWNWFIEPPSGRVRKYWITVQ